MNTSSAKKKGWRLESHLLAFFREHIDANTSRTAGSGSGIDKGDIRIPKANVLVEAKNAKTIKIIDWWEQANQQSFYEDTPVVIFRNPRKKEFEECLVLCALDFFTELLKLYINDGHGSIAVEPTLNYEQRSALDSMKTAMSRIQKVFPYES